MTIEEAEKADEPLSHESAVFLLGQFAFDHFVMGEPAEWWDAHVEAVLGAREEAVRQAERERAGAEIRYHLQEWHSAGGVRCTECGLIIDRFGVCSLSCEIGEWRRGWRRARSSEEAGNGSS